MREKQLRAIITFKTTTAAMAMEKLCMEKNIPGRLIPVPRAITAGCGMSWSAPPDAKELASQAAMEAGLAMDGGYELLI